MYIMLIYTTLEAAGTFLFNQDGRLDPGHNNWALFETGLNISLKVFHLWTS